MKKTPESKHVNESQGTLVEIVSSTVIIYFSYVHLKNTRYILTKNIPDCQKY